MQLPAPNPGFKMHICTHTHTQSHTHTHTHTHAHTHAHTHTHRYAADLCDFQLSSTISHGTHSSMDNRLRRITRTTSFIFVTPRPRSADPVRVCACVRVCVCACACACVCVCVGEAGGKRSARAAAQYTTQVCVEDRHNLYTKHHRQSRQRYNLPHDMQYTFITAMYFRPEP